MKRILWMIAVSLASGLLLAAVAQQQSSTDALADAARRARESRQPVPASRVFTNDNLPTQGSISTNTADTLPKGTSAASAEGGEGAAAAEGEAAAKPKDRADLEKEWRQKFTDQKAKVAQLQRDVDRIDREIRMQGTIVAFGDAGCLRDQQKCNDAMKAYQDELASKKQDLQTETDKLDAMRDELRRAGLPASWGE